MRVAYNGLFLGRDDGTGRYSREILRASAGLTAADDIDWEVITAAGDPGLEAIDDPPPRAHARAVTPPRTLPGENWRKLWLEQTAIPRAAAAPPADVLHYPYFAAPLRAPAPVVVTIHDLIPLILPEYRGSRLVRLYMRLQAYAARRARLILTDSNAARHDIVRYLGVPRQRVRVIPLGVDREYRPVAAAEVRAVLARHRLPERYLLYAGGLDARKNVERLILAYARARASHGIVAPLVITGNPDRTGAIFPPLRPIVARLGMERHVRFAGMVPREDLPALYSGCGLFLYPSRYEGFGLPVLEAMACGAIVACSNATSLPEVAGDAALLFAPDDEAACAEAIARGVDDAGLRADLAERARRHVAGFTWHKTAAATLRAYRDALELT